MREVIYMKMQTMNISVVIPAHNRENMIAPCAQSVMAQTYLPQEIIIVDDGSTDGTWARLEQMAEASPLIRPIRLSANKGAQHARNVGIRSARYPWIALLDSDDVWLKEKLAVQLEVLQQYDYDPLTVIYSDFYRKDGDAPPVYVSVSSFEPPNALKKALSGYGALFQTMLLSKGALEKVGYLDERVPAYQEWDTTIRLASICRFVHITKPLFIWVRHGEGAISDSSERGLRGYEYILDRHGEAMIAAGGGRLYLRHLFLIAYQWIMENNLASALVCLEKSKIRSCFVRFLSFFAKHKAPAPLLRFLARNGIRWQRLKMLILG